MEEDSKKRMVYDLARSFLEHLWVEDTSDWNYSGVLSFREFKHQLHYHALDFKREIALALWDALSNNKKTMQANRLKDLLHDHREKFEREHNAGRKASLEVPCDDNDILAAILLREWKTIQGAWVGLDRDKNGRISLIEFTKVIEEYSNEM